MWWWFWTRLASTTESGTNNKARWGGQYFRWWLEEQPGYTLYTRYPN